MENISMTIKNVFDHLNDDESRTIFNYRTKYLFDHNIAHLWDMLHAINEYDRLKPLPVGKPRSLFAMEKGHSSQPIIFYGVGGNVTSIKNFLATLGIIPTAYCDSDAAKWGTLRDGLTIISPDTLIKKYPDSPVIITSPMYEDEICLKLMDMGIRYDDIYCATFSERQYFGVPFITYKNDDIYVDVGTYDGNTVAQYCTACNHRYAKIYAMEMNPDNYKKTQLFIDKKKIQHVVLINQGAWDSETTVTASGTSMGSAVIKPDEQGGISVTTIDRVVAGDPVSYIKMDIEGAELAALKGAINTIATNKPQLAICLYHKPEDIWEIPAYLLSINPNYRFFIRHHAIALTETVLYAIA